MRASPCGSVMAPSDSLICAASRTSGASPSGPPIEDGQRAGAVVADLAEQLGESMAGQRLAALVERDDGIGVARQLQQRGAFLGAALGRRGGAAFAELMPDDRANPSRFPRSANRSR